MSQSLKLDCSSSSSAIKGEGKLMMQPIYQCPLCSRVFNKKQAFKNHKFMHLKKKFQKLKKFSTGECMQNSSPLVENKLLETIKPKEKSNENFDEEVSSNNVSQKPDKEIVKDSCKKHSDILQEINTIKDILKHKTTNQINMSTTSPLPSCNSAISPNADATPSYSCPFCEKVFTNRKTYLNHKKNHRKKRNSALKLTLTESNVEQVITNFIRSIRQKTESGPVKCDSPFDLRTVIKNASSNNTEFSNKDKNGVSPLSAITSENHTPYKCDKKSLDQVGHFNKKKKFHKTLNDFNKQADQKRIPLNQNIVPYC